MADRSWKAYERRLARAVHGRRIPVTGERDGADVVDGMFCYQAKLGRRFPAYIGHWLAGIRAAGARRGGKTGIVVWKPKGGQDHDAVVLLTFADWCELHVGKREQE